MGCQTTEFYANRKIKNDLKYFQVVFCRKIVGTLRKFFDVYVSTVLWLLQKINFICLHFFAFARQKRIR